MVPNGSSYDNFPSFANNGTKTPPGGSTESAKYALGMVPADTFPAEWANYLFHGATAGITRLNSDTGSIKKEINTVLSCKGITPDATVCDQLYCALLKIRDDAVARAYPVGTVYMNAKSATLPAEIQAIGTWCAIDGRFLRACSACIGCTCGADTVTLEKCHLPSHCHSVGDHCHSGSVASHYHSIGDHKHSGSVVLSGALSVSASGTAASCTLTGAIRTYYNSASVSGIITNPANIFSGSSNALDGNSGTSSKNAMCINATHSHSVSVSGSATGGSFSFTGGSMCAAANTGCKQPGFTGGAMCAAANTGNTGSGCSFSILPPYRDVAMWYRDA